jgi:hypothetical protein
MQPASGLQASHRGIRLQRVRFLDFVSKAFSRNSTKTEIAIGHNGSAKATNRIEATGIS